MTRRILTIGLAIVLALAGTGAVLLYVKRADQRAIAGQKAVSVLVATQQIPAGTPAGTALSDGMLVSEKLPAASVPANALRSLSPAVRPLVASADIPSGELLLRPMLVTSVQATSGVAIPAGMVAVTIALCMPESVAGYVRPGSEVAIFDTYGARAGSGSGTLTAQANCSGPHQQQDYGSLVTRMLLPKVQVISVGPAAAGSGTATSTTNTAFAQNGNSSTQQGMVLVTLAVDQADAERVINVAEGGLPYLALLTQSSGTKPDTKLTALFPPVK
ncbi:MAG: Flp pilus assembly protein CpaB [Streptosporangiaceae bacterium]